METIFENESFKFTLEKRDGGAASGARIVRTGGENSGEIILFDYNWPEQLTVEVKAENGILREDGVLCWQLAVTAHHVRGMAQGEFTETEYFELECPFGSADDMVCRTVDIVRKTRFAVAERHLKHLPNQTYPPVDGRQGPYGHP